MLIVALHACKPQNNVAEYHHGLLWCVCTSLSLTAHKTCLVLSRPLQRSVLLLIVDLEEMSWHLQKYQWHKLAAGT